MLLSFIFSPDGSDLFACFLKTVTQLLLNSDESIANLSHCKFPKISWRQICDNLSTLTGQILDDFAAGPQIFCSINSHKIFKPV